MEEFKSGSSDKDDEDGRFIDADGGLSLSICLDGIGGSTDSTAEVSSEAKPLLDSPSLSSLRRRRSIYRLTRDGTSGDVSGSLSDPSSLVSLDDSAVSVDGKYRFSPNSNVNGTGSENSDTKMGDSKDSSPCSLANLDTTETNDAGDVLTPKTYRSSGNMHENGKESPKLNLITARLNSGKADDSLDEPSCEKSTVTTANNEKLDCEFVSVDSPFGVVDDTSSSFLFLFVGFLIRFIGFQISLLIGLFTFPIKLTYGSFMFMVDPFRVLKCCRGRLMGMPVRIGGLVFGTISRFTFGCLTKHKSIWKMLLRFGWGLLWSTYSCLVLASLFMSAFVVSGLMLGGLMDRPITIKENLNFDYTKNSPVAHVPIICCPDVSSSANSWEKIEVMKHWGQRAIPPSHKLEVTVRLNLPESDYNRNLGIFQVRVDLLSVHGNILASSSQPCMLHFRSHSLRLMTTFMKIIPLTTGFLSESQTLNVKFGDFGRKNTPTACLRVMIEQRAEFYPGGGVPQIYDASLILVSELPPLNRFIWYWKSTIYIWLSMTVFTIELIFMLICCKPIILPRVRLRNASASQNTA